MENTVASLQSENTELDIRAFSNVLNDNDQGYKFFWFQCLLDAVVQGKREITFEDLIDHMAEKSLSYTILDRYNGSLTAHLRTGTRRTRPSIMQLHVDVLHLRIQINVYAVHHPAYYEEAFP